jgi:hypothetical protein
LEGASDDAGVVVGPVEVIVFAGAGLTHFEAVGSEEGVGDGIVIDDGVGPDGDEGNVGVGAVHFGEGIDDAVDGAVICVGHHCAGLC